MELKLDLIIACCDLFGDLSFIANALVAIKFLFSCRTIFS